MYSSQTKPRPRFKEASVGADDDVASVGVAASSSKKESPSSSGALTGGSSSSSSVQQQPADALLGGGSSSSPANKKFRKSGGGSGGSSKPSFLTGRGLASATRFLNYRFLGLQGGGETLYSAALYIILLNSLRAAQEILKSCALHIYSLRGYYQQQHLVTILLQI